MAFKKMNNLKRLIIESGSFTTGPKHLPNSLRVLEWWDYPSPSLPIDFHPKKLVKLELLGSCLMSLDLFMSKKFLNFSDSQNITEIPDLCGVPNLQELSFCNCENLIKIHESVGFLDKLKILYAGGYSKLTSFPPIKLTSLEELKLSYCGSLECFPKILGKMENVTSLDIKNTPIKEFPSSIQNLTQLQRIKLKNGGIIQLPSSIFGMKELRYFIVKKCEGLLLSKENEGEAQMTSMVFRNPIDFLDLSHSNISDEFLLRGLPLFANVKELHLRGDDFTILPACIKELQFLKEIYFKELHEADGYKLFRLPGPSIPEWFEHFLSRVGKKSEIQLLTIMRNEEIAQMRNSIREKKMVVRELERKIVQLEQHNKELGDLLKELREAQINNGEANSVTSKLRNKLRRLEEVHKHCASIVKSKESQWGDQVAKMEADIVTYKSTLTNKE
ncbi:hypothetical protein JHK85_048635 [Glycine max]|nr:hypothetical protein JHK85_048635 [Glycine max]